MLKLSNRLLVHFMLPGEVPGDLSQGSNCSLVLFILGGHSIQSPKTLSLNRESQGTLGGWLRGEEEQTGSGQSRGVRMARGSQAGFGLRAGGRHRSGCVKAARSGTKKCVCVGCHLGKMIAKKSQKMIHQPRVPRTPVHLEYA